MNLGVIGDDFTGASDIANTLAKGGMRVTQYIGIPTNDALGDVDCGVVSLKARTIDASDAVEQSLAAADWLLNQGCDQIYFKYCSTFDSTPQGNIGPVTEALMERVGETKVVMCPAFPSAGRTVYQGHLFVQDQLLSESSMRDHPLTPMTDPDIRRWLKRQTKREVSHLPRSKIDQGVKVVRNAIGRLPDGMIVADSVTNEDLAVLGAACSSRKLLAGGSGLALGLPAIHLGTDVHDQHDGFFCGKGRGVIFSGSCSKATRQQIETFKKKGKAAYNVSPADILEGAVTPKKVANWVLDQENAPLVYSSAEPAKVAEVQKRFGVRKSADAIEAFFGESANLLVQEGVTRIVSAGGETSGAVVLGLGLKSMRIGPEIAVGVPAMQADHETGEVFAALKSGNFGKSSFFCDALRMLRAT